MAKNVLILSGSPRKGSNTEMLLQAFQRGAEAAGHQVAVFDTAAKQIGGCRACQACWSKETACVFQDGFTELEPLLEAADVLVLASPIYWFALSAQLKAAIDRLYAYNREQTRRPLKIKETALLLVAGDTEVSVFEGAVKSYELMMNYLGWQDCGRVLVPDVNDRGAIAGNAALQKAEELGKAI